MKMLPPFFTRAVSIAAAIALILQARPSPAQQPDGNDDDSDQAVARVAFLTGDVSYNRGDDPDDWQPAALNFPMTRGDRLFTAKGARLELQTDDANVFLGSETELSALTLTDDESQLSIAAGTATFRIHRVPEDGSFEVGTPNASITFDTPGSFRVSVDANGNTRVIAQRGKATVASGGGQVRIEPGDEINVSGIDNPRYDVVDAAAPDGWDQWVESRARAERGGSAPGAGSANALVGLGELDREGRWQDVPGYGRAWTPNAVDADWAPYRVGHWAWVAPWGWTWVSSEAWGWAPYHYGRWVTYSSRWFWIPEAASAHARWSPALVGFVGAGPGGGGSYVGWFPLAPRDPFVPWWGRGRNVREIGGTTGVANVTYTNRNFVTVVNHDTFVSSAPVGRNVVRDVAVVKQVSAAPVFRGPIPMAPTKASLRISGAEVARAAPRPPAAVLARPVVTKNEPAPPKPRFDAAKRTDERRIDERKPDERKLDERQTGKMPAGPAPAGPQPSVAAPAGPVAAEKRPTASPVNAPAVVNAPSGVNPPAANPAGSAAVSTGMHRTMRPAPVEQKGSAPQIALAPHDGSKAPRRQVEPLSVKPHPRGADDKGKEPPRKSEDKKEEKK